MGIEVIVEGGGWDEPALARQAEAAFAATLARLGLDPAVFDCALLACDDARIAALNAAFRGREAPTNVLSWPSVERAPGAPGAMPDPPGPEMPELGDIAIAWETCRREAEAAGRPFADHVTHLLVHGTLHLLGFDHETGQDAALMEGLEVEILAGLGVPDPY